MRINSYDGIGEESSVTINLRLTPEQVRNKYAYPNNGATFHICEEDGTEHRWKFIIMPGAVFGKWYKY